MLQKPLDKEKIASLLQIDEQALDAFEKAYGSILGQPGHPDNFFDLNSRQASAEHKKDSAATPAPQELASRIVGELLASTLIMSYDRESGALSPFRPYMDKQIAGHAGQETAPVTKEEILSIPQENRPQLAGTLMHTDINAPSYPALFSVYNRYKKAKTPKQAKDGYDLFRQGLDILDLDPVMYHMIDQNPTSMGHWFYQVADAAMQTGTFLVPSTKVIKVPLPMLQLTRLDYSSLTQATLDIVDKYCYRAFGLEEDRDYFIKTGVYSSKFDFRNALVHGAKEVRELGEYLLFIHHQACMMAAPLTQPSIYGAATTVEWVVREFIHDTEKNPCIYKGLPLHTEYRVFVDFDRQEVLGIHPYWDPTVMKQRFGGEDDADSPHMKHDYVIYAMHEPTLMDRYYQNKECVTGKARELIQAAKGLSGQWSMDIMQNGNDFWLIDMALAQRSAFYEETVPKKLRQPLHENWIPDLGKTTSGK